MKKKIAIDLDDVISSQSDVFLAFSNAHYGTHFTRADLGHPGNYSSYFSRMWGVSEEEGRHRFQRFLDEMYPIRQVISPDTLSSMERLQKNFELVIVTSRESKSYEKATKKWLEQHANGIFSEVHFVDVWHTNHKKATKGEICLQIGAEYLVDDNAEHCNGAADSGLTALLFGEYGWNMFAALHENVVRVASWESVEEYFDKVAL